MKMTLPPRLVQPVLGEIRRAVVPALAISEAVSGGPNSKAVQVVVREEPLKVPVFQVEQAVRGVRTAAPLTMEAARVHAVSRRRRRRRRRCRRRRRSFFAITRSLYGGRGRLCN
jgi:hypothetical protein